METWETSDLSSGGIRKMLDRWSEIPQDLGVCVAIRSLTLAVLVVAYQLAIGNEGQRLNTE